MKLQGFIDVSHAVTAAASKREALARMEHLNIDSLPVVDGWQRFVGTVERAKPHDRPDPGGDRQDRRTLTYLYERRSPSRMSSNSILLRLTRRR